MKVGPFRLNFSKSGVGVSVGVRGLRTGIKADGTRYTEASIPGTGISARSQSKRRRTVTPPTQYSAPQVAQEASPENSGSGFWTFLILAAIVFVISAVIAIR